jgi:hypothetical protein
MAKVIVERPRHNSRASYRRAPLPDGPAMEQWRPREGMHCAWRARSKELNENLSPLWRFLRSRVGQPWDAVYSEVCQQINKNSAVQLHVWQHLMQNVVTDPHKVLGDVDPRRGSDFYVEPATGLLREKISAPRRSDPAPSAVNRIEIDATHEYRRLDGIWYELTLAPLPKTERVYDLASRQIYCPGVSESAAHFLKYYGRGVYATRKRQLNKKELRRLKLHCD